MKATLVKLVPAPLVSSLRQMKRAWERRRNASKSVEEVFTDIYLNHRWGGAGDEFCSGGGTRDEAVVNPYIESLNQWLEANTGGKATVVDLGCGDFTVGERIVPYCGSYVGVDVVKPLIEHHHRLYASAKVSFAHYNIITDDLPKGDVCLVRQVLQHLSKNEIQLILQKLKRYRWAIVTEHLPEAGPDVVPNLDKPHGADIRLNMRSGVFLEHAPFSIPNQSLMTLLEVPWTGNLGGVLRTSVIRHED